MVREEDITEGDHIAYNWFEMGIFTRWDKGECKVLCVDTPDDLPQKLMVALEKWPFALDFQDPFAMHAGLLDQIIVYYDIAIWGVRNLARKHEKVSVQRFY
jgi:hypothetical protein